MSAIKTEIKTKAKNYPCKHCQIDIEKGIEYVSVTYSDGFRTKLIGAFHEACWKVSPENPRAKKPC